MGAVLVERKNHSPHSYCSFSRADSSLAIVIHDWGIWNGSRAKVTNKDARMKNRSLHPSVIDQSVDRAALFVSKKWSKWEKFSRQFSSMELNPMNQLESQWGCSRFICESAKWGEKSNESQIREETFKLFPESSSFHGGISLWSFPWSTWEEWDTIEIMGRRSGNENQMWIMRWWERLHLFHAGWVFMILRYSIQTVSHNLRYFETAGIVDDFVRERLLDRTTTTILKYSIWQ